MSPAIELRGLRFSYPGTGNTEPTQFGDQALLQIESLTAQASEIMVLIGDNGCGKTTLLKLLAGLLIPDGGSVGVHNGPALLVHQRPYLFAESVYANVAWPLRIRRLPRNDVRQCTLAALEQVGLTQLARRWAPSLSGGEKQRAAIARALVLQPQVLLLDEPTSNIDTASIAAVERVLRSQAACGRSVIMSTHNLPSAYRLADRIVPMKEGRLRPVAVNILRGWALDPGDEHIGRFQVCGGPQIFCPAARGQYTTAVVRMDDIILSTGATATSAQNRLQGDVRAVELTAGELARVEIDCGCRLVSTVTHRSVDQLRLRTGSRLWVTFKASAVELY